MSFAKFIMVCPLLLIALYVQGADDDARTEAEGMGSSAQAALTDAKRNAVEQCIGSLLISQTEIENFALKKDSILVKTIGSVKEIEVLSEWKESDGSYAVRILAVVSTSSIKEDLVAMQILLESMNKPRLMVLIDEQHQPTVENHLVSYLTDKGFDLVDNSTVDTLAGTRESLVGNGEAAARVGELSGAEYIITGRATKSTGRGAYGMISGQVALSIRIINCSTARILTSKSDTASFAHMDEHVAMAKASERVASALFDEVLFEKLITSFQDMVNNGLPMELVVENVKNFQHKKHIVELIETLPNVVSVKQHRFSKGLVSLTIVYRGGVDSLCDGLDGKTVETGGVLSVTDVTGSRVVASWQPQTLGI